MKKVRQKTPGIEKKYIKTIKLSEINVGNNKIARNKHKSLLTFKPNKIAY